jgi:isochorismate synthase
MTVRARSAQSDPLAVAAEPVDDPIDLVDVYGRPHGFLFERRGVGIAARGAARTIVLPGGPGQVDRAAELAERALAGIRWHGGRPPIVVGALPFDGRTPATLVVPEELIVKEDDGSAWRLTVSGGMPSQPKGHDGSVDGPGATARQPGRAPRPLDITPIPTPDAFAAAVSTARRRIRTSDLDKVVLARMLVVRGDRSFDRPALLRRLRELEPDAYTFAVHGFVGATPELLVQRSGERVRSNPLAGTIRRGVTPAQDGAAAELLLASAKDRSEHAMVVAAVAEGLAPVCRSVAAPREPSVLGTGTVWHLSTEIEGMLREPAASALRLASLIHPTPAVCGTPPSLAMDAIHEMEPFDRTLYAGIVGWMDATGDGAWAVALRCAEVQGAMASLFAGAGIVEGSDPQAELAETDAKFASMLAALGASPADTTGVQGPARGSS